MWQESINRIFFNWDENSRIYIIDDKLQPVFSEMFLREIGTAIIEAIYGTSKTKNSESLKSLCQQLFDVIKKNSS